MVGLDTMAHVIKTMQDNLPDDPFFTRSYTTPACWPTLIEKGALGQKTGAGFYKKVGKDILRLDLAKRRLRRRRRRRPTRSSAAS